MAVLYTGSSKDKVQALKDYLWEHGAILTWTRRICRPSNRLVGGRLYQVNVQVLYLLEAKVLKDEFLATYSEDECYFA